VLAILGVASLVTTAIVAPKMLDMPLVANAVRIIFVPPSFGNQNVNVLFASDWGTATGTSENAFTDGGKWNSHNIGPGDVGCAEVVAVSDEGWDTDEWPTANALLIQGIGGRSSCIIRQTDGTIPVPDVGDTLSYRWYERVVYPDGLGGITMHDVQEFTANDTNWWHHLFAGNGQAANGEWHHDFQIVEAGSDPDEFGPPDDLDKNVTYRIEFRLIRTASDSAQYDARIHVRDSLGVETLLYDTDDYVEISTGEPLSGLTFPYDSDSPPAGTLQTGTNGYDVDVAEGTGVAYHGGYAVCSGNWCGPYDPAEADF
jgi:hypothetical protein